MIKLKPNKELVFKEIKGEGVLLNIKTGDYFGLNEVGADFFKLVDGKKGFEQILTELQGVYEVTEEVLRKDLEELVETMLQNGVLLKVED